MDIVEQRKIIKYYFLKGFGCKKIYKKIHKTFQDDAISISTIKRWLQRFKAGDLSCNDKKRSGRPPLNIINRILLILTDFPFSSAKYIAKRLGLHPTTIKEHLNDAGYKRYLRRYIPYELDDPHKFERFQKSLKLLKQLQMHVSTNFEYIITLDESWFYFRNEANAMFAQSSDNVPPKISNTISTKKCMVTVAFSGTRLFVIDILPKKTRFNQMYFIDQIMKPIRKKIYNLNRKGNHQYYIHMDNSRIHNGSLTTKFFQRNKIIRIDHPAYSPDISPCDFYFFGRVKNLIKENDISNPEDLKNSILKSWDEIEYDELQSVFLKWIEKLKDVIKNNGDYIIKQ